MAPFAYPLDGKKRPSQHRFEKHRCRQRTPNQKGDGHDAIGTQCRQSVSE
jgi:hypothetical protein